MAVGVARRPAAGSREIEPIYVAGNAILIRIMEPDEEPWGVQVIGPAGELQVATSYVGLPRS